MSVTHLRWVKKRNTDTKKDTRILKFFRKKRFKSTIVKRPCCLLLTPLPARLPVTFFWHNADLTSEVTSKMWRQNEEFDSLMSGFTSNIKCMQLAQGLSDFKLVKVKNDLFLKVKTRLNWLLHSGKAFASFPNIRRGVHIQQQLNLLLETKLLYMHATISEGNAICRYWYAVHYNTNFDGPVTLNSDQFLTSLQGQVRL